MRYEKQHLSFEQQADRLLGRGLMAERKELILRLSHVGYYRLSAYAHPYRRRTEQGVDLGKMGLPPHWEEHPLWK